MPRSPTPAFSLQLDKLTAGCYNNNGHIHHDREAEGFAQNLRGSHKHYVDGAVEGVMRYVKNGKYIDLAPDGTIISFGRA